MGTKNTNSESITYLVARIRRHLAEDARTNLLDIKVKLTAGKLFLLGNVESEARRQAAEEVARETAPPGTPIVNELLVCRYTTPPDVETIL